MADYDVIYVGRSRGSGRINSADFRMWVQNGGGAILESDGDNYEPYTSTYIWSNIYDVFGYNNCPNIDMGDNAGCGSLTKFIDHQIWEGVSGTVGDNDGLYDSELDDYCIGTGVKIGSSSCGEQNPMVNQFGLGRTYSGVEIDYTVNEDSERFFLNIVNWVAQGSSKGVIPMQEDWNDYQPFYCGVE